MYNPDTDLLAEQLIPPMLRKPKILAYLRVVLKELNTILATFQTFITETREGLNYNGQTESLELFLNTKYPAAADQIYIDNDTTVTDDDYSFFSTENQSDDGQDMYFNSEGQPGITGAAYFGSEYESELNFLVMIPSGIVPAAPADADFYTLMKRRINKYKAAGMRYAIQTF